jgi:beta-glucosidase
MTIRLTRRTALAASTAFIATAAPRFGFARPAGDYRDPSLPIPERVRDLLARMTLEEKAAQLLCLWEGKVGYLDADRAFSEALAANVIGQGVGQISRPSDIRGYEEWLDAPFRSIPDAVKLHNALQRFLVTKTRLGIPALGHDELAHGLLAGEATIFPTPPALGSTWDPALVEQVFTVAAREARVRGSQIALTPVIDLARDPRFGRVEEMFGEDAFLVARMGVAAVHGLQGRQRPLGPERVFATLKHFVHGSPAGGINLAPADISERTLRARYLVPFKAVIAEADPAIIMASYNEVQGIPAHANVELLQATGRRRLGFKGMYSADYGGIGNLKHHHHVARSLEDAAVLAMNAGIAVDLPEGESYRHLPKLVREGRLTQAQVDAAVSQVLALKFEAGLFENPYLDEGRALRSTRTEEHTRLARLAAEKAVILLKNDGLVPLEPKGQLKLAVIGPNAKEPLFGGYSGGNDQAVGILDGIRQGAPDGVRVDHADGVWITPPDAIGRHRSYSPLTAVPEADNRARIAEAVALAERSDVVLLVVGDVPALSREGIGAELPGDRSTLGLWGMQDDLIEAVAAAGKPIIALLLNGRPLAVGNLAARANALFEGWYLGQEGGPAFADILFGRVNPGGKLPVSIPGSVGDLPVAYDVQPSSRLNSYIEGGPKALFAFGHGLSYTTFDISAPRLAREQIGRADAAVVEVDVVNTGRRSGDEVVQIYIRDEVSSVPRPVLELKAFERVTLAPGERRTLRFELTPDHLAFWDFGMNWTVEPGAFTISSGSSSAALKSAVLHVS